MLSETLGFPLPGWEYVVTLVLSSKSGTREAGKEEHLHGVLHLGHLCGALHHGCLHSSVCITGVWMERCIMGSLSFHVISSFLKVSGSRAVEGAGMEPQVQSPAPYKAGLAVHPVLQHLGGGSQSI